MSDARRERATGRKRKLWIGGGMLTVALAAAVAAFVHADGGPAPKGGGDAASSPAGGEAEMVVYRAPSCGCCELWVEHMREAGFEVRVEDRSDVVDVKRELGVPSTVYSCHTAVVDGHVVEGHVPAETVRRWLSEGAPGEGLAVPGMPAGSPGMPSSRPERYSVLTYDGSGATRVYERC